MNLTTDSWIPVVWNVGKPGTVSLREAFERGHEIQDLAVRPHERIALMRLLICIAQAALDGPADYAPLRKCFSRGMTYQGLGMTFMSCPSWFRFKQSLLLEPIAESLDPIQ